MFSTRRPGSPRRVCRSGSKAAPGTAGRRRARGGPGPTGGCGCPASRQPGVYRLTFASGAYFGARGSATFYPEVTVTFEVTARGEHYHVPLLLSPFAYSTYRGS